MAMSLVLSWASPRSSVSDLAEHGDDRHEQAGAAHGGERVDMAAGARGVRRQGRGERRCRLAGVTREAGVGDGAAGHPPILPAGTTSGFAQGSAR